MTKRSTPGLAQVSLLIQVDTLRLPALDLEVDGIGFGRFLAGKFEKLAPGHSGHRRLEELFVDLDFVLALEVAPTFGLVLTVVAHAACSSVSFATLGCAHLCLRGWVSRTRQVWWIIGGHVRGHGRRAHRRVR